MIKTETTGSARASFLEISVGQLLWMSVYILAISSLLYLAFSHWTYDDPFITYRYAHNLATGLGFVYNPSERVLSTTTPLFAMLLALPSALGIALPAAAAIIGAASLAFGGLFLWQLGQSWDAPLVGWAGLLLYPTFPLVVQTLSSETPLYLAFCLGALAFYAGRRYAWTAAFSALALLTRPDGVLIPLLLGAHFLFFRRPREGRPPVPWKALALFAALTLPWFLFAWLYFGSPLPVTLAAKQQQGQMAVSQQFLGGFIDLVKAYAQRRFYLVEAVLAAVGLVYALWRKQPWLLLLSWTGLYFAGYALLGVSRYFWYYAPLAPGFVVLVGLGLQALYSLVTVSIKKPSPALLALGVMVLVLLGVFQSENLLRLRTRADARYPIYRAAGEWLNQNTPPDSSVGALEVGIIGYYADRPMIDFAGLIQPEVAAQMQAETTYAALGAWAVQRYQPEFLVLQAGAFPQIQQEYIAGRCTLVEQLKAQDYDYITDLEIYDCR